MIVLRRNYNINQLILKRMLTLYHHVLMMDNNIVTHCCQPSLLMSCRPLVDVVGCCCRLLLICSNEILSRFAIDFCPRFCCLWWLFFRYVLSWFVFFFHSTSLFAGACCLDTEGSLFSLFARKCKRWTRTTATSWWAKSNGWLQKQGWRSIVLKKIRITHGRACVSESLKLTMDCELAQRNQSIEITASPTMVHVSEL